MASCGVLWGTMKKVMWRHHCGSCGGILRKTAFHFTQRWTPRFCCYCCCCCSSRASLKTQAGIDQSSRQTLPACTSDACMQRVRTLVAQAHAHSKKDSGTRSHSHLASTEYSVSPLLFSVRAEPKQQQQPEQPVSHSSASMKQ